MFYGGCVVSMNGAVTEKHGTPFLSHPSLLVPACRALGSAVFPCAQQHQGAFLGSDDVLAC